MTDHLIDPTLLEIMQCPSCTGTLVERHEPPALVCANCGLQYPVRDGIPVMLIDEASPSDQ
ncbi:MAG: Trm112 family protein [Actinomycetota bacterium]|nr:Trm112 family protein [Actinomycetota bacterium]